MGFGLPAAIGAAVAAPSRPVVALIGDGGLAMSGLELLTAARERIPLMTIVFCDGSLGLIRAQQIREFGHTHGVSLDPMDLAAFAAAVGVRHVRLESDDPARLLGEARAASEPVLVEVAVGDSAAARRQQAVSYARSAVRNALGPRLIRIIKGWLR
jgi:thiamine pyrophosphate-dependent acetolactate synthase large subunit-like protein